VKGRWDQRAPTPILPLGPVLPARLAGCRTIHKSRLTARVLLWLGARNFPAGPDQFATLLVDREKGLRVRKLELRAQDGRLLGDGDTQVRLRPAAKRGPRKT